MVHAKVIGPRRVLGVAAGGTVELDPERYNIDALVAAGHVELAKPARKAKADESEVSGG